MLITCPYERKSFWITKKESIQNNSQPVTATIIPSFILREPQGHIIAKPKLLILQLIAGYEHRMRVKNVSIE